MLKGGQKKFGVVFLKFSHTEGGGGGGVTQNSFHPFKKRAGGARKVLPCEAVWRGGGGVSDLQCSHFVAPPPPSP